MNCFSVSLMIIKVLNEAQRTLRKDVDDVRFYFNQNNEMKARKLLLLVSLQMKDVLQEQFRSNSDDLCSMASIQAHLPCLFRLAIMNERQAYWRRFSTNLVSIQHSMIVTALNKDSPTEVNHPCLIVVTEIRSILSFHRNSHSWSL